MITRTSDNGVVVGNDDDDDDEEDDDDHDNDDDGANRRVHSSRPSCLLSRLIACWEFVRGVRRS
eukprot:2006970-Amphidinium_carterae.1